MRRTLLILLLSIITISATDLLQFMKLPTLASHYLEHKADTGDLSFVDFLIMHYASHDDNDQDQEKDMQLPFKDMHQFSQTMVFWSIQQPINPFNLINQSQRSMIRLNDEDTQYSHISTSIWQPPKHEQA
jgi:hypothetical protein